MVYPSSCTGDCALHYLQKYSEIKEDILKYEYRILSVLSFILHCDHPHKLLISLGNMLALSAPVMQDAWNIANDR